MPKKYDEPIVRYHTRLFKSDLDWLKSNFKGDNQISTVLRTMLRSFRLHQEAKERELIDQFDTEPLNLNTPELDQIITQIKERT